VGIDKCRVICGLPVAGRSSRRSVPCVYLRDREPVRQVRPRDGSAPNRERTRIREDPRGDQKVTVASFEQEDVPASHTRYVYEPPPRALMLSVYAPSLAVVAMSAPSR
jgi:hypothetical protein